jgi:hypothetical protein
MTENNLEPEICVWTYWVRPECEDEFRSVLSRNWPTLHQLGFVTSEPPTILRSSEDPPVYVEIMTWEPEGMRPAHDHPDVIPIWEALKRLVEDRQEHRNVAGMSFPFYQPASLPQ